MVSCLGVDLVRTVSDTAAHAHDDKSCALAGNKKCIPLAENAPKFGLERTEMIQRKAYTLYTELPIREIKELKLLDINCLRKGHQTQQFVQFSLIRQP